MKKQFLPVILIVIFLGALVWFWLGHKSADATGTYSGYGEGEYVYLSSPLGGQLQELNAQRGDQVEKGKPLFLLERQQEKEAQSEADETLRESQTRLDKAKLDFDRNKSLRDKRVIAPEDYDAAEQALLEAQHTVAARQQSLEQANWRYDQKAQAAPVTGLVYDTYYRPGEWVPPGTPILSILPPEYMKVRFFVPEADLGTVQVGAPLEIHLDGLKDALPGKVSFISPTAEYTLPIIYSRENRGKLVFLVEGSLAPEDARKLHPGAPIEVKLGKP